MERIAMNQEERDKLEWLKGARDKVLSQREAAEKIGISDRWVRKLLKRMKQQGDSVVVHGLRGRASNRKIEASTREQAMEILKRPDWHDFGPTFASEPGDPLYGSWQARNGGSSYDRIGGHRRQLRSAEQWSYQAR